MRLFLIRHGRTQANSEKKLVGQKYDGDLTEFGIKQVQKLACELTNKQISVIFTSPLIRAKHSADILNRGFAHKTQVIIEEEAIERDYGEFELLNRNDLKAKKEAMGLKTEDITNFFPNNLGGVETRNNVFRRIQLSLNMARTNYGENSVIAYVTHAGVIYSLITESLGISEERKSPFTIYEAGFLECNVDIHNILEIITLWNNPLQ